MWVRKRPLSPHLALSAVTHPQDWPSVFLRMASVLVHSLISLNSAQFLWSQWLWYPALIPFLWTGASVPEFIKFLERTKTMVSFYCSPYINHNLGWSWWKMRNSDWDAGKGRSGDRSLRGWGTLSTEIIFEVQPPLPYGILAVASFQNDCSHKTQTQVHGDHIVFN